MRNLKRALSLTLASVMLLGMMVVGSSALSFNDADDITNVTAASVLEDLGIMQGDGSGNFMPDRPVTRAQMAIIICRILYGNKLNVSQFEGTTQYTDVAATEYYTGYINLATQLGIIGGYGDGRFGPNDTVTTAQAALMLSRALGYFKGNEIAQAQDWALAAVAQATKINMFGELKLATNAELARDNVAEMVFNAITATVPVQYNELLGVYYNENQGIIYALNFNYLETLGYKNFDLVYRDDTQDIYGRPARTWGTGTYNTTSSQQTGGTTKDQSLDADGGLIASRVRMLDKNEIITVALAPDYVYTEGKDQDEVWKDLGRSVCTEKKDSKDDKGYVWTVYNNGELLYEDGEVKKNYYGYGDKANYVPENVDDDYVMTHKGAQTEIYVDDGDATVTVVEINYYIGEVTRVSDNTITVKSLSTGPNRLNIRTADASGYEVEDVVVFTVDQNDDDDFYICETFQPQTETGTIKRVEKDDNSDTAYVRFETNGTKYNYADKKHMVYDLDDINNPVHPDLEEDYILYMDPNGYVLAYEQVEDGALNYLYVKDSDEELKDWVAKVIYADATTAKVDVKKDLKGDVPASYKNYFDDTVVNKNDEVYWLDGTDYQKDVHTSIDGVVWEYSKNSSDTHTLTWADAVCLKNTEIFRDRAYVGEGKQFIVDLKTVFIDVEDEKVYTGYEDVPNVKNANVIYVLDKKGVADVVFIIDGDTYDDGYYFVLEENKRESYRRGGSGGDLYWEYIKAYVDGSHESVYVEYGAAGGTRNALEEGVVYKATKTEIDGDTTYVEKVAPVAYLDGRANLKYTAYEQVGDVDMNMLVFYARKNGYSFSLVNEDNKAPKQYTANADTKFILVEETYTKKDDCVHDGWIVREGSINDLEVIDYREKMNTYVTVVQDDGNELAEIVYILKTNTRYPVVLTDAAGASKTFWAKMTVWDDATRTPVVEVNIPASELGGKVTDLVVDGDVSNDLHQDAAGNLVGTVTISDKTDGQNLSITGKIDTTDKPADETKATVVVKGTEDGFKSATQGVKFGTVTVEPGTEFTVTLESGYTLTADPSTALTKTEGSVYTFKAPAAKETLTITIKSTAKDSVTLAETADKTMTGTVTGGKVNKSYPVGGNGNAVTTSLKANASFTLTAPTWAAFPNGVNGPWATVTYTAKVGDQVIAQNAVANALPKASDGSYASNQWSGWNGGFAQDATKTNVFTAELWLTTAEYEKDGFMNEVKFKEAIDAGASVDVTINSVTYYYVGVEYKSATSDALNVVKGDDTIEWMAIGGSPIKVKTAEALGTGASAKVSGIKDGDQTVNLAADNAPVYTIGEFKAEGGKKVTVTVTPGTGYTPTYAVSVDGKEPVSKNTSNGIACLYIKNLCDVAENYPADAVEPGSTKAALRVDGPWEATKGDNVLVKISTAGFGADLRMQAITISGKINGEPFSRTLNPEAANNGINVSANNITGDVVITDLAASITMADLYAVSASVDDSKKVLTITFNDELDLNGFRAEYLTKGDGTDSFDTIDGGDYAMSISGKQLIITFKDDLAATAKGTDYFLSGAVTLKNDTNVHESPVFVRLTASGGKLSASVIHDVMQYGF